MKQEVLDALRQKLEQEKTKLQKQLESFAVQDPNLKGNWNAKPVNAEDTDMEEKADESQEYDNLLSLEHSLELSLKDVNSALEKMDSQKYGLCEKCGKEIMTERLMAAPEAKFCMACNPK